jgi:hypothetical protein
MVPYYQSVAAAIRKHIEEAILAGELSKNEEDDLQASLKEIEDGSFVYSSEDFLRGSLTQLWESGVPPGETLAETLSRLEKERGVAAEAPREPRIFADWSFRMTNAFF